MEEVRGNLTKTSSTKDFYPVLSKRLSRPLTIYIPCHNCKNTVVSVIREIPEEISESSNIVLVDNFSSDGTSDEVLRAKAKGRIPAHVTVVKTSEDLGYSGSQKLAYSLVRSVGESKWVVMLHGDGQYPPELLNLLPPLMNQDLDLVYGYRSKLKYGRREETPLLSWAVIKVLNLIETGITGCYRKEWHSGFVMYSTKYLKKINLESLTTTPHIDGHMLYVSGLLGAKIKALPIFKRYKELTAFEGAARRKYVFDVLKLMFKFRRTKRLDVLKQKPTDFTNFIKEIIL